MRASDQTKRHLGRFLVSGTSSVLIDLAVYTLVSTGGGASRELAKAAGYAAGLILGFFLNKTWTFESRGDARREALAYALIYAVTFVINVSANSAFLDLFQHQLAQRPSVALAFLLTTGITTVLNFLAMRFVIFRRGVATRNQSNL